MDTFLIGKINLIPASQGLFPIFTQFFYINFQYSTMDYPVLRIWFLVHLPISLYFNNLFCTLWTLLYYYSTFIVAGILSWPNMDFLLATCGSSNCGCDCGWCTWNATQNWRRIWKRAFGSYVSLCTIFYSSQKYPPPFPVFSSSSITFKSIQYLQSLLHCHYLNCYLFPLF